MFDKSTNTTEKYKLNPHTSLVVKNNKIEDERGETYYRTDVTIKHKLTGDKPLTFSSPDDIDKFVNDIDFEDPQMKIPGTDGLPIGHDRKDLN